jgi:hypothetical protein
MNMAREDNVLIVKLVKYHEFGNLIMTLKVPRNPVLDYMEQAAIVAKPYAKEGWQMAYACIE